jgi:hypothetical protein
VSPIVFLPPRVTDRWICSVRWRAQRRPVRAQEMERDARDRNAEATQLANAAREAEEFLARQAEEFAAMTAKSLEGGLRLANGGEDDAAVKLSFNPSTTATKPVAVRGVMGVLQEEEESVKKRELIPLSYSDDEDDAGGRKKKESTRPNRRMTDRERERKTKDVTASVPSTKEGLWAFKMPWVELSDVRPFDLPGDRLTSLPGTSVFPCTLTDTVLLSRLSSARPCRRLRPHLSLSTSEEKKRRSSKL